MFAAPVRRKCTCNSYSGHKSDKKGHKRSWWTNRTLDEFYKRKQCIIDPFNNYTVRELEGTDAFHVSRPTSTHLFKFIKINSINFQQINGSKTQGENIADYGGLREAFKAYQNYVSTNGPDRRLPGLERFTAEQIFFLSFANVECSNQTPENLARQVRYGVQSPSRYRILGPLSSSVDFIKHYQCPAGSPMNRSKKCSLVVIFHSNGHAYAKFYCHK